MDPTLLLVASKKIWSRGPAPEVIIVSISRDTNRRAMIKIRLVARPIATHATMINGPSTVGLGISGQRMNDVR
jgi:hypothetical protein